MSTESEQLAPNTATASTVQDGEPEAAAPSGRRVPPWVRTVLLLVVGVAVITAGQLLRQRGARSWRTLHGEDGTVFYAQLVRDGFKATFNSYAGYYMASSRWLIIPASWLPVAWVSAYAAVAGSIVTSLLALAVYHLSGTAISSRALRIALAISVCLNPALIFAIQASITNLLWPLLLTCFWAIVSTRERRPEVALRVAVCFVTMASTIVAALLFPLALYFAWRRRARGDRAVVVAMSIGLAIQAVALLTATPPTQRASRIQSLPDLYANRVLGSTLFGENWVEKLWLDWGFSLGVILIAAFAVLITLLFLRSDATGRLIGLVGVGYSVVMFCSLVYFRGSNLIALSTRVWNRGHARIVAFALLLLLGGLYVLISRQRSPRVRQVLIAVALVQIVAVTVFPLMYLNGRSEGADWPHSVAVGRERCRETKAELVSLEASPRLFRVVLPCSFVLEH